MLSHEKKNVVIIHTDQQRYDSLGCSGNPCAITPNIDSLASEGSVFERHITSNPICMPSRASLFTGLYPPGHNVYSNGIPLNRREYVKVDQTIALWKDVFTEPLTMGDMFLNAGYNTASFGKLHLTPNLSAPEDGHKECLKLWQDNVFDDWHGPYYGFEHVEMTKGHGEQPCFAGHYHKWLRENHPDLLKKVIENQKNGKKPIPEINDLYPSLVPGELHHSTWLAERFSEYVNAGRDMDKPFFAFVGFPDPHAPFNPSYDILEKFKDIEVQDPWDQTGEGWADSPIHKLLGPSKNIKNLEKEKREMILRYTYAMVYQIDLAVGKIIETIRDSGLWDDTIIIFTSDHGDFLCDHAMIKKEQVGSDALLHVPFILRAPGVELPERVKDIPMSNCDVMPTLAYLTGIDIPENLHGVNILDKIRKNEEHYAFAFCADGTSDSVNYTVYDKRFRFTWYPDADDIELFDHKNDPGECKNIAADVDDNLKVEFKNKIKDSLIKYNNPIHSRLCAW
jgi:arylsulfatase A-like enzyme